MSCIPNTGNLFYVLLIIAPMSRENNKGSSAVTSIIACAKVKDALPVDVSPTVTPPAANGLLWRSSHRPPAP
jgi:hypothetical protein